MCLHGRGHKKGFQGSNTSIHKAWLVVPWEMKQPAKAESAKGYGFSEAGTATHSSTPAWSLPWAEEPGGLQSTGLQRARHNWSDWALTHVWLQQLEKMAPHFINVQFAWEAEAGLHKDYRVGGCCWRDGVAPSLCVVWQGSAHIQTGSCCSKPAWANSAIQDWWALRRNTGKLKIRGE